MEKLTAKSLLKEVREIQSSANLRFQQSGMTAIIVKMTKALKDGDQQKFSALADKLVLGGESFGLDKATVKVYEQFFWEVQETMDKAENWEWQYNYLMGRR